MGSATLSAFEKACKVIPGGVSSPLRSFRKVERMPIITKRGKGDLLFDLEDKSYVDFCMGNGAVILGHAPSVFTEVLQKCMEDGFSYGTMIEEEEKLASLIISHIPSIEKVRFFPSGTESCMTAIRLARAFTGKKKIVKFSGGYHGHSDSFLVEAGSEAAKEASSLGILEEVLENTVVLPFNNTETLLQTFLQESEIAAVIVEPVLTNVGLIPATWEFLTLLQELCKAKGVLLIFDEIVTGYRLGLEGAQGYYKIKPDLTCLGKIIGGGAPCAALGGRKEILQMLAPLGPVFHAGTFAAHPLSIRLGIAVLSELENPEFYQCLEEKTERFLSPIQKFLENKEHCLVRLSSMFSLFGGIQSVHNFEDAKKQDILFFQRFFHFLFDRGVFLHPSYFEVQFLSRAHTEENLQTVQALILEFLEKESFR